MNWLISANGKIYDHASSFAHYGSVDWRQGNVKYNVGDIVYIYCTNPIQRVRYKCKVKELNKNASKIRDDKEYWINKEEYIKSLSGKFFNLELIESVDTEKLSLSILTQKGLKAAPQGPKKIDGELEQYISYIFKTANDECFPETLSNTLDIFEGLKKQVYVNKYERSSVARMMCIENYGYNCRICLFNFEEIYGDIGKDFIHVHHLVPIHTIGENYKIDYSKDLIPVCPNCHAMLHRKINGKLYSAIELTELIKTKKLLYK